MELASTQPPIAGLKLIELRPFLDERGFFIEHYQAQKFAALGLPDTFLQDNHSRSKPHVIRGLHLQLNPAQGKFVKVIQGRILDVAVDLRPDSPTFKKHFAVELSCKNHKALWIPGGFAHGFCVLGDEPADVMYKVDAFYDAKSEKGIRFDDPELGIAWPLKDAIVSKKDLSLPWLKDTQVQSWQWN